MGCQGDGFLYNISLEGISFIVNEPLKFDFVELSLVNSPNEVVKLDGRIIHCSKMQSGGYLAGIRFFGPHDEVRDFRKLLLQIHNEMQNDLHIDIVGFLSH